MNINTQSLANHFNKQSTNLAGLDDIYRELAERVISRLDYIKLLPHWCLECGSGLGIDAQILKNKYPSANLIELDCALLMLKQNPLPKAWYDKILVKKSLSHSLCADAQALPLVSNSIDFVYANLLLPYLGDSTLFIQEVQRVLKIGGAFCFSGLGVDSLKELRALGINTLLFPDMHDVGDMLLSLGFSNPVVDTEYITLNYDDLLTLINDLRVIFPSHNNIVTLANSWSIRKKIAKLCQIGKRPNQLTLELFVAHGWKDKVRLNLPNGQSVINFHK